MTFAEAVKLNPAYSFLKEEAKDPMQSYLFVSPDALTNELCAKALISFLSGYDEVDTRKDVYFLPFGEKVLTSDADFVTETAYLMPTQLDKKYFILRKMETANEAAQNKLLKTLEEPPETAVIILLCANEYTMLPTVRSRCRTVRPSGFSDEIMRSVLDEEFPSCPNPSFAIAIADGSLEKLKTTVENGTESFDRAIKTLMCMRKSSEILPFASELASRKEKLGEFLDSVELILRDCMVFAYRPALIKLKDNFADIRELSAIYTPEVVLRERPVIMRARKRIASGGNVNSIIDELLFSILEEKAKCQK